MLKNQGAVEVVPLNRNALWRILIIILVISASSLYALPNLFGEDPAIQISAQRGVNLTLSKLERLQNTIEKSGIKVKSAVSETDKFVLRFNSSADQLKAKAIADETLGRGHIIALNLAPATPMWLSDLNAQPMYLGLDLRGGVYFLMEVDVKAALNNTAERRVDEVRRTLREARLRYVAIKREGDYGVRIKLVQAQESDKAIETLERDFTDSFVDEVANEAGTIVIKLTETAIQDIRRFAVKQNITTLRNRVNELGVAEPIIQQQGANRIIVQLPGVQDTARAKQILGATATLEYRLVDDTKNARNAARVGFAPPGTKLYYFRDGTPILLKRSVIVTGDSVVNAQSGIDGDSGTPMVSVTLDSAGGSRMLATTKQNINKRMAVVFIETRSETVEENGEKVRKRSTYESVINAATIRGQFANRFQTTGLDSPTEARDLALLLRAGALAAPMDIVEERTIGPSLGADNINQGFLSVMLGLALVLIFMIVRYKVFGLIANMALCMNLVLIVSVLSLLQATLTLPGIAGIVLTVGMAVDANVLIFERIREELRKGQAIQLAISAGYERAFITIADANVTTLIAALVLFGFGTGPIKGFAVTLSIGILSSMFTAILMTRVIVNSIYGKKLNLKKLPI